jgi:hypothetical protein
MPNWKSRKRSFWKSQKADTPAMARTRDQEPCDAQLTLPMPHELLARLETFAKDRGTTPDAVIRMLLRDKLPKPRRPKPPETTLEALRIDRAAIVKAFHEASSWSELQAALLPYGVEVAPKGGGVAVQDLGSGAYACNGSELGYGYMDLIRRFREGLPAHANKKLVERVLSEKSPRHDQSVTLQ